ncbi:MAG: universal stress protein [Bacteroidales bacterium]|nr:universal stress protein [Bacteroidales bacterium]
MRHIILLTDFSETARHAASYALNMFEGRDVRFYLFNAYDVEFSGSPYVMRVKDEMAEESRKGLKRELALLHSDFPATDLKTIDQDIARPLFDLVSAFDSELLFVNVMEDEFINRLEAEEKIAEFFPGVRLSFFFLDDTDICNSVCTFTEEQEGDMVVLVRHNYSFFERIFHPSITKKMVLHPQFPMFVLHTRK